MSRSKSKQLVNTDQVADPKPAYVDVTPEMATDWLENHNPLNRNIRLGVVDKYSRDRVNGKWLLTHEGIGFDDNDDLVDGQQRLSMVVKTGLTTRFLVVRGLEPRVRMAVDIGAPRRPADILKLMGWTDVSNTAVAIVRSVMNGFNKRASIAEIVDAYEIHHDAANAVLGMFPNKRKNITIAPVLGPMARAWYSEDVTKLEKFAAVLYDGLASRSRKGEASIILLRDFLMQLGPRGGDWGARDIYGRAEAALYAFLTNTKLDVLEPTKEELFPLTTDEDHE